MRQAQVQGLKQLALSFAAGVSVFVVSFAIVFIAFGFWATWQYPEHNSMAGVIGGLLGIPIGIVCGGIAYWRTFKKMEPPGPDD